MVVHLSSALCASPQAVVTNCQPILSLDLAVCKKEQLQFKSEFLLTACRNDFVHAIVAYFDCQFSQVKAKTSVKTLSP